MFSRVALLETISGKNKSLSAAPLKGVLWLLSPVYRLVTEIRNRFFDWGWKSTFQPSQPVVSIGNLTTGGTGKTPMVMWFASRFRDHGIRVAILSRGYGALADGENDEARELAARLPDVPHLIHRDRRESARIAIDELEMQVLLLDDGFQHRQLARDLDVVLIDALCPFGFGYMLPRGLLREHITGLKRADAVVITRCDAVSPEQLGEIEITIRRYAPQAIIGQARFNPQAWIQSNGERHPRDSQKGRRALMLCAIGNPLGFQQTLTSLEVNIVRQAIFADHYSFSDDDLKTIRDQAEASGAEIIACTWKDLVKINRNRLGPFPLYALEVEAEIVQGQEAIEEKIEAIATRANTD